MIRNAKNAVVCVVDRRRSRVSRLIRAAGYPTIETYTPDHAVALLTSEHVSLVVLDQGVFVKTDGWSVAQSIKLVRPQTRVLLVASTTPLNRRKPKGVDRVVADTDFRTLIQQVQRFAPHG